MQRETDVALRDRVHDLLLEGRGGCRVQATLHIDKGSALIMRLHFDQYVILPRG